MKYAVLGLAILLAGAAYGVIDIIGENQALRAQLEIAKAAANQTQAIAQSSTTTAASVPQSQAVDAKIIPSVTAKDHIQGSRDADIILVEYSDYDCPFCKQLEPTILAMQAKYGSRFAWVYRQYPLAIHPNAELKSEVGECIASIAGEDAFWKYSKSMFEDATVATKDDLLQRVTNLGIDASKVNGCLGSTAATERIISGKNEGSQAGIRGTPASFLIKKDGSVQSVPGALPLATYQTIVDGLLN